MEKGLGLLVGGGTNVRKGFLTRMFSWIQNNLGFIPAINNIVENGLAIIGAINDTFGTNWKISDPSLTTTEATFLDNWDLKEFQPFYANVLK